MITILIILHLSSIQSNWSCYRINSLRTCGVTLFARHYHLNIGLKERIVSNKVFLDNKKPLWIHNGLVSTANPQSLRGIRVSNNSIQLVVLSNQLIANLWSYFVCSPLSSQHWFSCPNGLVSTANPQSLRGIISFV
jgi:hypothetical protein